MKFWTKTNFWQTLIKSLALFGTPAGIGIAQWQNDPLWLTVTGVCGFLSAWLAIVMVDKDNNGIIDWFEKDKDK